MRYKYNTAFSFSVYFPFNNLSTSVGCFCFVFPIIVMFFSLCIVRMASWVFAWLKAKDLKNCPVSFNEQQSACVLISFESKSDLCSAEFQMGLWNYSLKWNPTRRTWCWALLWLCPVSSAGVTEVLLCNCRFKQGVLHDRLCSSYLQKYLDVDKHFRSSSFLSCLLRLW